MKLLYKILGKLLEYRAGVYIINFFIFIANVLISIFKLPLGIIMLLYIFVSIIINLRYIKENYRTAQDFDVFKVKINSMLVKYEKYLIHINIMAWILILFFWLF